MTTFTHTDFPTEHRGVARAEAAFEAAGRLGQGFKGARGVAALLLAAAVSAVLVMAGRLMDSGNGLLATWLVTWVALVLFAAPARRLAAALARGLEDWSVAIAEARADQRLWAVARADARVMGDLQAAMSRAEVAPAEVEPSRAALPARVKRASSMATPLTFPNGSVALRDAVHELGARRSYYY